MSGHTRRLIQRTIVKSSTPRTGSDIEIVQKEGLIWLQNKEDTVNAIALPLELEDGRLDELLVLWTAWMRSSSPLRELWYPDTACGCVGGGYSQTFEDMLEAADSRSAEAVDAAVDSLPNIQRCAVMHKHLYAVFRFKDLEGHYIVARGTLRLVLPKRGVY
jgi:hypothetical protein